jgi:hypothetical protein
MGELRELIKNNEHEKILSIEGEGQNEYKAIACIFLERYEDALRYVVRGGFEEAYIRYKLKDYRKCVRILNKNGLSDARCMKLKAQALYFLGYYDEAYQILSSFEPNDETIVNLMAIRSLGLLASKSGISTPHRFSIRNKEGLSRRSFNVPKYKVSRPESVVECEFNKCFEVLDNEEGFKKRLKDILDDPKLTRDMSLIENQYKNVTGRFKDVEMDLLSRGQRETLLFNMGKKTKFQNPCHFQPSGFLSNVDTDWKCRNVSEYDYLMFARNNDYSPSTKGKIPGDSQFMVLLRRYIDVKNGKIPPEDESVNPSLVADMMRFIYRDRKGGKVYQKMMEGIFERMKEYHI